MDPYQGGFYSPLGGGWCEGYSQASTQSGTPSQFQFGCPTGSQGFPGTSAETESQAPPTATPEEGRDDSSASEDEIREDIDKIKGTSEYYKWNHEEEVVLIEAMKLAKEKSHKSAQGFKKSGWGCMLAHIKTVFPNTKITEGNVMNHVKSWRKQFIGVLDLKGQSGTGWSDVKHKFKCSEAAWKAALKKHGKVLGGKRKKHWEFYEDWVEIYGTDRAAGKKAVGFQSACKKVLASDRYKSIVADSLAVNEDGLVETSSNFVEGDDSTAKSKRRRKSGPEIDLDFFANIKAIVGPAPISAVGEDGKDLRTRRIEGLDVELHKHPQLQIRDRIMIGDIIASGTGKLEHFYSLCHEDREEYLKVELVKMGKPIW